MFIRNLSTTVVVLLFASITALAVTTPHNVIQFYSGLKTLQTASSTNIANSTQQEMAACFLASEQSGINLSMDGMGEMSSSLYTMKLYNMIFSEKSLGIKDWNITKTEMVEQPDQSSSMQRSGSQHYVSYVTKQYIKDGKTVTYNDIVFTLISNGLIVEMENSETTGNTTPRPKEELSVEQLRARAAYNYSKGYYDEAYRYYETLMSKRPTDGDAAYRIALMTFWRKGCKNRFSRREAKERALSYLSDAISFGNSEIKRKAINVKTNWKNKNVYY